MTGFSKVELSLADVLGEDYVNAVCEARAALSGESVSELRVLARQKVEFLPQSFLKRQEELLVSVDKKVCAGLPNPGVGAGSDGFQKARHTERAPLSGFGWFRVGEAGRLHFITKSEHYHTPLGHAFHRTWSSPAGLATPADSPSCAPACCAASPSQLQW